MPKKYAVLDLFCGVGGLSHGFVMEKFEILAGIDYDNSCKFAFESNNKAPFIQKDLTVISSKDIKALFKRETPKILIGCAPCTSFSSLTQKYKGHDQWKLLYSFGRIIREVKPDIVSMENVPRLLEYDNGKVFNDFLNILISNKYHVFYKIVNAADYGVPQKRRRLILLASRYGDISLKDGTHKKEEHVTVKQSIGQLPKIDAGETCSSDPLHRARNLNSINKKRIIATPEGGSWKNWSKELVLECHKKKTGKSFSSVYGRMKWDEVAPTLTTLCTGYGNGRYGHPVQNRAISLREAAILQSFPESYEFINPAASINYSNIEKHIGNAVPVLLAKVIARSIKQHLNKHLAK